MKKKHLVKKALSLGLVAALSAGALAGCGEKASEPTGGAESSAAAEESERPKLTYWVKMDSSKIAPTTDNFGTIACYKELMDITGIDVEFLHPPVGQESDSFNLMIAGGSYPDIIHHDWANALAGGPDQAIEDGIILDLAPIIDEKCPYLSAFLDEHPDVRAAITTDSGKIYCFPSVYPYFEGSAIMISRGVQIRKDWLEELGLEAPETVDEWYNVLTAFKNKGTTESGEPVIPLVSRKMSAKTSFVRTFANAWDGLDYDFYVDDDVVKFGPIEPEFKEYLATMNKWYSEGLIAPEFTTYDNKEHDLPITTGQAGAWLSGLGAGMGVYIPALGDTDDKIEGIKFPVVNKGDTPKYTCAENDPFIGWGVAITTSCKDIDAACKWLDYHYSEEGSRLLNWGIEGESYVLDDAGQPQLSDAILHDPDGLAVDVALGRYAMVSQRLDAGVKDDMVEAVRMWNYQSQIDASEVWNATDFTARYPQAVYLTPDEASELSNILSDITTYRDENVVRFIVGSEPLENYDKFVETVQKMNIERAIEIKQAAYDRLQARMEAATK